MSVHGATAAHVRANAEGHLALRVDGQHPADIPFLLEQSQQRAGPAAIASGMAHAMLAVLVVLLGRSSLSHGASPADAVDRFHVRSLDPTFGLDEQAIAAVKQWRFAPGTRAGRAVSVQVMIELTFTLR